jgi:hypothetical protein
LPRSRRAHAPRQGAPAVRPGPLSAYWAVRAPAPHGRVRIAAPFPYAGPSADPPVRCRPLRACGACGAVRDPTPEERPGRGRLPNAAARVRGRLRRGSRAPSRIQGCFAPSARIAGPRPGRTASRTRACMRYRGSYLSLYVCEGSLIFSALVICCIVIKLPVCMVVLPHQDRDGCSHHGMGNDTL